MKTFERLFGVSERAITPHVIVTPFLKLEYFQRDRHPHHGRGFLFETLTQKKFSVVRTSVGASFVADALMYLRETPCRNVYFIGSCAAVSSLVVGDVVIAERALAFESVTDIIWKRESTIQVEAHRALRCIFKKKYQSVPEVFAATLASLSQQSQLLPYLKQQRVDVVDMETSAFLSAAQACGYAHLALLYVTDIINRAPFYRVLSPTQRSAIKGARMQAIAMLCDFLVTHRS